MWERLLGKKIRKKASEKNRGKYEKEKQLF